MIDGYREGYRRGFSAVRDAVRDMRRDHPRGWLSFKLAPVRLLLMVGAIRACTDASGWASFAALASAIIAWAVVEAGVMWAVPEPTFRGQYGAECIDRGNLGYAVIVCSSGSPPGDIDLVPHGNVDENGIVTLAIGPVVVWTGPWPMLRDAPEVAAYARNGASARAVVDDIFEEMLGSIPSVNLD